MEQEIVLLLVELTAVILIASPRVELIIKETAVMEKKLEWCAKVITSNNTSYKGSQEQIL